MSSKTSRRKKGSKSTRAWPIEVTAAEFDDFLWNYGTNIASKDVKEHLVSLRLVEKLQDREFTDAHDPSQGVIDEAEEKGEMWWPTHTLAVDTHTFLFEDDEKRLALARLEKNIGRVPPALGADFEVLRQKFVKAESIEVAAPPEESEKAAPEEPST